MWTPVVHRRVILAAIGVLCVVLLVVLPPYISVSRYQRRVATAISGALGRPVHFDSVSLQLLPVPGLTIQNFVVSEDEAFGTEPVLRANIVTARLRFASLWRRRIEVSRISLDAPSVNLVRRSDDGRWNFQGILQQASQLNSAPTAQARPSDAPRFPYIEATGARLNFKNGVDKLPFSIKETDFAVWLPQPDEWHLRLSGRPVRTDTDVSDVGLLRVEGTLGRAADLQRAPINLSVSWKHTPLGEAAKLTAGYDLRWRGDAAAEATLHGTVGSAKLTTNLHVLALRRADFFPEHPMQIQAHCEAILSGLLRSASDIRCAAPTGSESSFLDVIDSLRQAPANGGEGGEGPAKSGVLLLRGEVGNLLDWRTISGSASLTGASPMDALAWVRLFTRRIPQDLLIGGTVDLTASTAEQARQTREWNGQITCDCILPPIHQTGTSAEHGSAPAAVSTHKDPGERTSSSSPAHWAVIASHDGMNETLPTSAISITVVRHLGEGTDASGGPLQGPPPAPAISGQITPQGYTATYLTRNDAELAAALLPPLGDGMPAEATGELQSEHLWNGSQRWNMLKPSRRVERHRRRKH